MSSEYIEPFRQSFLTVLPQLGIEDIDVLSTEELGKKIVTPEVVCIIGLIGDLRGNVIFAMGEGCALKIASDMMCGMEVPEFDDTAQSAIAELGNMLSGTACTDLSVIGITADVSTPTIMRGTFTVSASTEPVTCLHARVGEFPFSIFVSVERK